MGILIAGSGSELHLFARLGFWDLAWGISRSEFWIWITLVDMIKAMSPGVGFDTFLMLDLDLGHTALQD